MARCEDTNIERTRVVSFVRCMRPAKWKVTYYSGRTELVCGYCKAKIVRETKNWPEYAQPKFEKL